MTNCKYTYFLSIILILLLFFFGFTLGFKISFNKNYIFTEYYIIRKYHIAGTIDYQYVVEFVFPTSKEAKAFCNKIEKSRKWD